MNEPHDPTKLPKWGFFALAAAFIGALAYPTVALYFQSDLAKLGQFGDMFGALNAVISSFGFVGLLISLHLQRRQFRASLADMRDNADAAREETEAIREQIKEMRYAARLALAQNGIAAQQSYVQKLSALLTVQIALYDTWYNTKISTPAVKNADDAEKIAADIVALRKQLEKITTQTTLD